MPRSQRMKLIVGPRSRWRGKNWKSLTIMPRLSRYQFSALVYVVLCSTTWPSRWTVVGTRGGRWVALTRLRSSPKLNVCGLCVGNAPSRWVPATTCTGTPLGSTRSTASPPILSGNAWVRAPVAFSKRSKSSSSCAVNAIPRKRVVAPRRMSTHGAPGSEPRSCNSLPVRNTVVKPNARANASARVRSGFSNSSQAMSCTLMTGFRDRPGWSPLRAPCSLCRSWCAVLVIGIPSICRVNEMAVRDADWPRWCGAAYAVEDGAGLVGDGVAAPGDVMVGPDQHQIALVQPAGMIVADIDDLQRHSTFGCRGSEGVDVEVGESQQGEAEPE